MMIIYLYSHIHGMLFPENLNVLFKKNQNNYNKQEKTKSLTSAFFYSLQRLTPWVIMLPLLINGGSDLEETPRDCTL